MRDTENSTNECSEYDWNKGLTIALDIHKCGESSEGERDVEYESIVLERGDSSGRVEDDDYEISVCEQGESRGREGNDEWKKALGPIGYEECHATCLYATGEGDVNYESSVLYSERDEVVNLDGDRSFRKLLDNVPVKSNDILRYERIFGHGFVSTGGIDGSIPEGREAKSKATH
ncbi:phosphoethanolamine N-methyltransferase [Artemisia annua]|uniref:Phosphoethanolamine N-methyltransferase n=1 Tax=Artemisia annua TaxID=35608 RepID=A0A2U1PBW6_ARTAN|nr:phosphoethanolamine N-methyltransferase [Artemisia annua]